METTPNTEVIPEIVKKNPELLPVWDWWVKEGRSTLVWVLVAGLAVAGFYGVKNRIAARNQAASVAAVSAQGTSEIELALADAGSAPAAEVLRLRLAKSLYDEGKYDDALAAYDACAADGNAAFADIVKVGRAFALEGKKDYAAAKAAFGEVAEGYLALTAKIGAARCTALAGDAAAAEKALEELKAAQAKGSPAEALVENALDLVKRPVK